MNCVFCDSVFADPVLPHNRQKICDLFNVSFNGKRLLHDGRVCTRCHVQVDLIDNAMKLKTEMSQCLQDKLGKNDERMTSSSAQNGSAVADPSPPPLPLPPKMEKMVPTPIPSAPPLMNSAMHSTLPPSGPPMLSSPSLPPASAAEMMAIASFQSSLAALASAPMMAMPPQQMMPMSMVDTIPMPAGTDSKPGPYMCIQCGQAFKEHAELMAHDSVCLLNSQTNSSEMSPVACDRCGQSVKFLSPEERIKHIVSCKGQGLRRGRPSTGIINCPKCGLKLKNRMNQDRINHVQRCNGSGLKRGRPSLKSGERFQCEKCHRNLWSREQLELHAAKCDGSHPEKRGRKPGDNICLVCGENLIYRHLLKKHLRQHHGINPQNLDDSVIAAVKNEHSAEDLSTPYKKVLMNQIQQQLVPPPVLPASTPGATSNPQEPPSKPQENGDETHLSQSCDSSLSHRKKGIPCKYVPASGESFSCDRCEKVFEQREHFEQHPCFIPSAIREHETMDSTDTLPNEAGVSCDRCEKYFYNQHDYEQHECVDEVITRAPEVCQQITEAYEEPIDLVRVEVDSTQETETKKSPARVDDVISAISAKAEAVGPASGIKGSAIAHVISLLGANKQAPNNSNNSNPNLPPVHRQSIST